MCKFFYEILDAKEEKVGIQLGRKMGWSVKSGPANPNLFKFNLTK